jgi:hypothetical protein
VSSRTRATKPQQQLQCLWQCLLAAPPPNVTMVVISCPARAHHTGLTLHVSGVINDLANRSLAVHCRDDVL